MRSKSILLVVMVITLFAYTTDVQATVVMDWVTVGNPGNADDTHGDGYGGVSYVYQIGKYEVTAGQYTDFLNAVAATDTYGLYNTNMWSNSQGCKIQQSGSWGNYTYSVATDYANRPLNYVSWGDSVRFANWLHNGQPTGAQDLSTTEDGSYYVNGATTIADFQAVIRKAGATVWLPSEDEWYKAAYYKSGDGGYSLYANGLNTVPTVDYSWNYGHGDGSPWDVGTGTEEQNGTFDMMGNVWEWNEVQMSPPSFPPFSFRGSRGGSYYNSEVNLRSSNRIENYLYAEYVNLGFRVASVPEPCTLLLLGLGGLALRRKHRA